MKRTLKPPPTSGPSIAGLLVGYQVWDAWESQGYPACIQEAMQLRACLPASNWQ